MSSSQLPEGVISFLDTDLYKLTMHCAVLKFFPSVEVEFKFNNRTPHMRLNRTAFEWLQKQISQLANIRFTPDEKRFLQKNCPFLKPEYLDYMDSYQLRPDEQVTLKFTPVDGDGDFGDLEMLTKGLWVETILYEIPLLALTSEAYFKFVDTDWNHDGQEEKAYQKGLKLFAEGCMISEFGSRRRRDFKTHDLIVGGLVRASKDQNGPGKLTGTSNVCLAMKHGIVPQGTVAHEWYMGIAALTQDYEHANELGLKYWLDCYGPGVLGIALTDTFGTPDFYRAFKKPVPAHTSAEAEKGGQVNGNQQSNGTHQPTYAEVFAGVRQDSGDPKEYIKLADKFYTSQNLKGKTIIFSDSLNVEKCIEYKNIAQPLGFTCSFGVGTFFTNDFERLSKPGEKSKPLNIVIKIASASGNPAIKISDNIGKNTGDSATVKRVKQILGYNEKGWQEGDEAKRW